MVKDTGMIRFHQYCMGKKHSCVPCLVFISVFLADGTFLFPENCACLRGKRVACTRNNTGEDSSVMLVCCSPYFGKKEAVLLPLCTVSAVIECGSSLVEELINEEEGGKKMMYLSVQEVMLRQRGIISTCGFFPE